MPPMPSMEGQQGDVSKPVTQIPPKKKSADKTEKKEAAKVTGAKAAAPKPTSDKTASPKAAGANKPVGPHKKR